MDSTHLYLDPYLHSVAAERRADGDRNRLVRDVRIARRADRWYASRDLIRRARERFAVAPNEPVCCT